MNQSGLYIACRRRPHHEAAVCCLIETHTRVGIVHVRDMTPGQSFIDAEPKRRRLALVSVGHADGFPRSWHPKTTLHAIVGGYRCPVTAPSSLDLLAIDVLSSALPGIAAAAARHRERGEAG